MLRGNFVFFNSVKIPGRALAARLAARTVSKTVHMAPQDAPLFFLRARRQNPFLSENEHILIFHDVKGHALGVLRGCSGDVLGTLWPGPGNLFKNALFPNPGVFLAGFLRSWIAIIFINFRAGPKSHFFLIKRWVGDRNTQNLGCHFRIRCVGDWHTFLGKKMRRRLAHSSFARFASKTGQSLPGEPLAAPPPGEGGDDDDGGDGGGDDGGEIAG